LSGLPLLNFPIALRRRLVDGALERLAPGAPFVQFSYAPTPRGAAARPFGQHRAAMIWANLPPARVWVYRKV